MRSNLMLCVVLGLASAAYAKDPKPYQTGTLMQMDSVFCGTSEKDTASFSADTPDTNPGSKNTHEPRCQEYVIQSERVIYRVRPRDQKYSVLLPVGEQAQFRLQKDKMLLRLEDLDDPYRNNPDRKKEEREYIVVSMTPRSESSTAAATPTRLNHLE